MYKIVKINWDKWNVLKNGIFCCTHSCKHDADYFIKQVGYGEKSLETGPETPGIIAAIEANRKC